jgi:multiple sugar transport system substrate-binding protein
MRLKSKITFPIIIAAVLLLNAFSLAAPVEVTVWSRGTPQYLEAYKELEKMFAKEYPNIVIKHFLYADLEDKLLTAYMGGETPDIWICDTVTTGRWVRYHMAAPIDLTTISNAKMIIPRAWETCKGSDGKTYGVPWSVQAMAMYYRADWLAKLKLKVPTTWDEMVKVAVAFTTQNPEGKGKNNTYGIGIYGSTNRGYAYWLFQSWLWQAGGSILKPGITAGTWVANIKTAECRKTLQFEKDLAYKYKVVQPGFSTADAAAVYGLFADGAIGMVFHAGYRILEYKASLGEALGTALMPSGPANGNVLGEGENIYVSAATPKNKEARLFANWMISKEAQKFGLNNKISNVVRTAVRQDIDNMAVTGEPLMKAFVNAFYTRVRYPEPIPDYYPVKLLAAEMVQKAISSPNSNLDYLMSDYNMKINTELKKQGVYGGR